MKTLIVYDSVYGNTEKIANSIGDAVTGDVKIMRAGEASISDIESIDILIVGAPTYGGRPTPPVKYFISNISAGALNGIDVMTFDTRLPARWVKIFGFAAGKIANSLKALGGNLQAVEGFFVLGGKGPLKEGEIERASDWAKKIVNRRG
ncbi:MAG: flavodoxin family protein [Dehalococcoidia bacterium]|nr:MAG: flavodoxin family protein [Dehalococcoidia bacterium]